MSSNKRANDCYGFLLGDLSVEERIAFEKALEKDPSLRGELRRCSQDMARFAAETAGARRPPERVWDGIARELAASPKAFATESAPEPKRVRPRPWLRFAWPAAAALLIALNTAQFLAWRDVRRSETPDESGYEAAIKELKYTTDRLEALRLKSDEERGAHFVTRLELEDSLARARQLESDVRDWEISSAHLSAQLNSERHEVAEVSAPSEVFEIPSAAPKSNTLVDAPRTALGPALSRGLISRLDLELDSSGAILLGGINQSDGVQIDGEVADAARRGLRAEAGLGGLASGTSRSASVPYGFVALSVRDKVALFSFGQLPSLIFPYEYRLWGISESGSPPVLLGVFGKELLENGGDVAARLPSGFDPSRATFVLSQNRFDSPGNSVGSDILVRINPLGR